MYRSKAWRRQQEEKKIAKRLDIVKNAWQYTFKGYGREYLEEMEKSPHRYSKFNLNCGCSFCKMGKFDIRYWRHKQPTLDSELDPWYDDQDLYDEPDEEFLREIGVID